MCAFWLLGNALPSNDLLVTSMVTTIRTQFYGFLSCWWSHLASQLHIYTRIHVASQCDRQRHLIYIYIYRFQKCVDRFCQMRWRAVLLCAMHEHVCRCFLQVRGVLMHGIDINWMTSLCFLSIIHPSSFHLNINSRANSQHASVSECCAEATQHHWIVKWNVIKNEHSRMCSCQLR